MQKKWRSIIQPQPSECFLCGAWADLEKHHCMHGTANRKKAEETGCYVMLCAKHHRLLHDKGLHDKRLQMIAQAAWMDEYSKTDDDCRNYWGKLII